MTGAIRKLHDFLTVGAPAPLQQAGAAAVVGRRRDILVAILTRHRFHCFVPDGAYYVMTDITAFGFPDDVEFAKHLVEHVGVAAVPGSSFYRDGVRGRTKLRFCFSKRDETLFEADKRLARLSVISG